MLTGAAVWISRYVWVTNFIYEWVTAPTHEWVYHLFVNLIDADGGGSLDFEVCVGHELHIWMSHEPHIRMSISSICQSGGCWWGRQCGFRGMCESRTSLMNESRTPYMNENDLFVNPMETDGGGQCGFQIVCVCDIKLCVCVWHNSSMWDATRW